MTPEEAYAEALRRIREAEETRSGWAPGIEMALLDSEAVAGDMPNYGQISRKVSKLLALLFPRELRARTGAA